MAKLYLLGIFVVVCAVFVSARNTYQKRNADIDAEIDAIIKNLEDPAKQAAEESGAGSVDASGDGEEVGAEEVGAEEGDGMDNIDLDELCSDEKQENRMLCLIQVLDAYVGDVPETQIRELNGESVDDQILQRRGGEQKKRFIGRIGRKFRNKLRKIRDKFRKLFRYRPRPHFPYPRFPYYLGKK